MHDLVDHDAALSRVLDLVQAIQQEECDPAFQRFLQDGTDGQGIVQTLIVFDDETIQRDSAVSQPVGVGGEGQKKRHARVHAEDVVLAQCHVQGQVLQESGLARPRIAQHDETALRLEEIDHGQRLAQPLAGGGNLFLAPFTAGHTQVTRPGLAFRELDPRLERHVEVHERQAQRHAIGDAHALQFEVAIAVHQIGQILLCRLAQVWRWPLVCQHFPECVRIGYDDNIADDVAVHIPPTRDLPGGDCRQAAATIASCSAAMETCVGLEAGWPCDRLARRSAGRAANRRPA